jgi:hypothetical protein
MGVTSGTNEIETGKALCCVPQLKTQICQQLGFDCHVFCQTGENLTRFRCPSKHSKRAATHSARRERHP